MLQRSGGLFAAGSHQLPRWLWGLLRQARLPQFGQHSELSSVLAARAQGQENAGAYYYVLSFPGWAKLISICHIR